MSRYVYGFIPSPRAHSHSYLGFSNFYQVQITLFFFFKFFVYIRESRELVCRMMSLPFPVLLLHRLISFVLAENTRDIRKFLVVLFVFHLINLWYLLSNMRKFYLPLCQ